MSTFQEWTVEQITNLTTAYNTLVSLKKNINQLDEITTYETGMYIAVYDPTQSPPKTIKFPFSETGLGYATEAYVNNQILNLIDSAPSDLNTLNEIAAAINDDPNFHTTVNNLLALKLNLTGGTLTGTLNGTSASFTGALSASNLSGTNTGDQDLSGYLLNTTDVFSGKLTIQDTNTPALLVLRDTNDSGVFVTAYMSFTGLNNVEQGYVGFTNGANSKLYLHGLDGVQIEGTLYGTDAVFNGNVGVGANLEVIDPISGNFSGQIKLGGAGSGRRLILRQDSATEYLIATEGSGSLLKFGTGAGAAERMRITSGGDVNIKGNNAKLGWERTSDSSTNIVYLTKTQTISTNGEAKLHGYDGIMLTTGGTEAERMRIDASGNIQIGSNNDPYLTMISGGGNGHNQRFRIYGYADGGTYGGGFKLQTRDNSNVFNDVLLVNSLGNATFAGNIKSSGTILPETNNVQTITGSTSSATIGADINVVVVNTSVNCTLTIATTTNIASIKVINIGTGTVSFTAGTGVTINNILDGSTLTTDFSGTLTKIATNSWIISQ